MELNKPNMNFSSYNPDVSPVWAQLLAKSFRDPEAVKAQLRDTEGLLGGLAGKGLLDMYIDPYLESKLPSKIDLDLEKKRIKYKPTRNLGLTLGKSGDMTKFGLNWRF